MRWRDLRWLSIAERDGLVLAVPLRPICGGEGGGDSSGGAGGANDFGGGTGPGVSGRGLTGGSIEGAFDPVSGGYTGNVADPEGSGGGFGGAAGPAFVPVVPAIDTTRAAPSSGGGGGGGGGGGEAPAPSPFQALTMEYLQELLGITRTRKKYIIPTERAIYQQGLEALNTGGIGARIPMIQQALEQSKQAGSRTLAATEANLAGANLGGTVFGQRVTAAVRQGNAQSAAAIPPAFAQQAINLVGQLLPSGTATLTQGLVGGAGVAEEAFADQLAADTARAVAELQASTAEALGALEAQNRIDVANIQGQSGRDIANINAASDNARADRAADARNSAAIGSAAGTVAGAVVGTYVFPGIGTLAGAAIGGAAGGATGGS